MRLRHLVAVAGAALALPAAAQAQPNTYKLELTLQPGQQASMTIGTVPQGEFGYFMRASSDDEKLVTVKQKRNGGSAFTVLNTASAPEGACEGAAGSIICSGITTPATPGGKSWTFTVKSTGPRPTSITLRITFRKVPNAG